MSAYELYKPFRNYLRQLPLLESLAVVRAYLQYLQFGQPLPKSIQTDQAFLLARKYEKKVFEWELELIAKELILNSSENGSRSMTQWRDFSNAINKLKTLENAIAGDPEYKDLIASKILLEVNRIAHRQVPWQRLPDETTLTRYFKIFGDQELDRILKRETGLDAAELYTVGLGFIGHYSDAFAIDYPVKVEVPGITAELAESFVTHFSSNIVKLKEQVAEQQSYDQDYAYTYNPLKTFPLVHVVLRGKNSLIAPIPTYLFRRFTEGVYYEICNSVGFSDAFGRSFQKYVGDVLVAANRAAKFEFLAEKPYHVGKELKDSVDWIVVDQTGSIFVECKTKKLRYASKVGLASTEMLDEDLEKMSGFVLQVYKTLVDAIGGNYTHWKPADKPIYPIIVTLEEWYAFGKIAEAIEERALEKLKDQGIDPGLLKKYPYSICSVDEFERAIQIVSLVGVHEFFRKMFEGAHRKSVFRSHILGNFRPQLKDIKNNLFSDDLKKIHPALA